MNYSFKSKCQGCFALQSGDTFTCSMGIPIICDEDAGGNPVRPAPSHVKCYKPKTAKEWREAKKLTEAKAATV